MFELKQVCSPIAVTLAGQHDAAVSYALRRVENENKFGTNIVNPSEIRTYRTSHRRRGEGKAAVAVMQESTNLVQNEA